MALVVIMGGVRSGKSSAAENLALERATLGQPVVVAVFGRESDAEMSARLERHRSERPESFETIEPASGSAWVDDVSAEALLVVDCLGTALGREMELAWLAAGRTPLGDAAADALPPGVEGQVDAEVSALVAALLRRSGDTIVVTNEVGAGVVPHWASGRLFRDVLGRANRELLCEADAAYLCVAGRFVDLSRWPRQVRWPED
jgi:adenosylcobinamide kinase/adenosylcobinamide-phosphate guanylyltransferase